MNFYAEGEKLRERYKNFILDFMISNANCSPFADGLKQAEIFRECGMDWGPKQNCSSQQQQYWIVAILRELEEEGAVQRDPDTKKWRLK